MRKHAKLAEFARHWPDLRETCATFAQTCEIVFATLTRNFARDLRPRLLRYRLFLSEPHFSAVLGNWGPRPRQKERSLWHLRDSHGVPLASGALSVFGFCGFLRNFWIILRIFSEFCGCLRMFADCLRKIAEFSRIFADLLRNVCGNFAEFCGQALRAPGPKVTSVRLRMI